MPLVEMAKRALLEARQSYCDDYYYSSSSRCRNSSSAWYSYGRWILFAAIVVGFFLIFLLFSCVTARRRRRMGHRPFYGTGWAAGGHGQPQYTNQQSYYGNQPSVPSNQYAGGYNQNQGWNAPPPQYGEAQGYYNKDGQQNGVELQQPNQAYQPRAGDNVYNPPAGPPPNQDHVVR